MKVAIIGLAQSGKTTVFKSLAGISESVKDPHGQGVHVGNVKVPDPRLERLAEVFKPPKVVPADMDFMDVAGGRVDQKGVGLTPQVITEIRNADAFLTAIRAFENPSVIHPLETLDPLRDIRNIEAELSLNDMIQTEKRLQRIDKEHSDGLERETLLRAKDCLDAERPLRLLDLSEAESRAIAGYSFLSQKPALLLLNIGENEIGKSPTPELIGYAQKNDLSVMQYCAEIELEISELEPGEQAGFLAEMGLQGSGRERLVRKVYEMLRLISFFTIADTEIRAWSVPRGVRALTAAGKVHSDMERGFIRAEVINFKEFNEIGSLHTARESGHLRLEGKEYEVCDGDLIRFRFHV
ncbi:MAG: redox-regulated ATPase YchF [Candidatus Abyssobacteria bacterium SURF_17]|jgi:GTP-binding protein YchF|uniref:Redox-regulated ATPase YchF n=1 Tax=Candidatus Abyssobacteria bacterium SURF_17 TaxID=2093361 RepID=A0A419EZT3_9BACT|nr:MAG: redox-regulated ATPase YchF [Candidatus Abyssubacteria bacterium SURF_17]